MASTSSPLSNSWIRKTLSLTVWTHKSSKEKVLILKLTTKKETNICSIEISHNMTKNFVFYLHSLWFVNLWKKGKTLLQKKTAKLKLIWKIIIVNLRKTLIIFHIWYIEPIVIKDLYPVQDKVLLGSDESFKFRITIYLYIFS